MPNLPVILARGQGGEPKTSPDTISARQPGILPRWCPVAQSATKWPKGIIHNGWSSFKVQSVCLCACVCVCVCVCVWVFECVCVYVSVILSYNHAISYILQVCKNPHWQAKQVCPTGLLFEQFESAALIKDIQAWVMCTAGDQWLKTFTFICSQTPEVVLQFILGKSGPEAHWNQLWFSTIVAISIILY